MLLTLFSLRKIKQHPTDKPWITTELKILIQQRQQAMFNDPLLFKNLINKVNRLCNRLRSSFLLVKLKTARMQLRGGNPFNSLQGFLGINQ